MWIKKIKLINFRNYQDQTINLNQNLNIILGNNAQGKTNLLESIYICSTGGSFRTNRDNELINFNSKESYIGINYESRGLNKLIEVKLEKNNKKRIKINKLEIKKLKDLQSGLSVVLFSPDDLDLIKGGPSIRRSFLDKTISEIRPIYKYNLARYNKILYQRNSILKSQKKETDIKSIMEIFNMQIIEVGASITLYRKIFLEELNDIIKPIHLNLTDGKENLKLNYNSSFKIFEYNLNSIKEEFNRQLEKNYKKDIILGTTSVGPHRDDFNIYLNDKDARNFGSQGQQRTSVLSIKLAEVEAIKKEIGEYPILLLDDVFSELDEKRRDFLTNYLKKSQTMVTATSIKDIGKIEDINVSIHKIKNAQIH